jgi:hypothetical protein
MKSVEIGCDESRAIVLPNQACLRAVWSVNRADRGRYYAEKSRVSQYSRSNAKSITGWMFLHRSVFGHVDGLLSVGIMNRQYYLHYGVPQERGSKRGL